MSKWIRKNLAVLFLLSASCTLAGAQQPAFPGAEGYGSYSKGGREGVLIPVTSLDDSGPGSLRAAVEAEGPRTVVFEVGGTIDLKTPLRIENPRITIAGQTAPGPGITLRGQQLAIQTHDVVIRFLRFRPGDHLPRDEVDWGSLDAVDIGLVDSDRVHDIILDHCSFSWATDENIGIWHNSRRVTIQNSIISEGLHHHRYNPDSNSQGLLIGAQSTEISVLRNLFAHNFERNPYMNANGTLDFRNNIIYNGGDRIMRFFSGRGVQQRVNLVGNLILPGPDSRYEHEIFIRRTSRSRIYNGRIYLEGNRTDRNESANRQNWRMVVDEESRAPFGRQARALRPWPVVRTSTLETDELPALLLPSVGASLPVRDPVDLRIVSETENGGGAHISHPGQVLGWPMTPRAERPLSELFEAWREESGVDLSDSRQASSRDSESGYTQLELFLNSMADGTLLAEDAMRAGLAAEAQEERFGVSGNFPNPFRGSTLLKFTIAEQDEYRLEVFDTQGRRVQLLIDRRDLTPGDYEMRWEPERLASGIYFLRLRSGNESIVRPMTLIR